MAQGDFSRVNTNIAALNALNSLKGINKRLEIHQLRLATGKRINEASDDPAGLVIAKKFEARARGLGQALNNIGDAKNLLSVAEGGLESINDIIIQMQEKITQAASDTLSTAERDAITSQLSQLTTEIDRIVAETTWNARQLISSTAGNWTFQTGANPGDITTFSFNYGHTVANLKVSSAEVSVGTYASASNSIYYLTTALASINASLQLVGALVLRLGYKEDMVSVSKTNTEAASSRIMDADMALEQLEMSKYQILQQTATAMLAQANLAPQSVLSFFR